MSTDLDSDNLATARTWKASDIEALPSGWSVYPIGELFDHLRTASNSRADIDNAGAVSYVHYGDIHTLFGHYIDFSRDNLPRISASTNATATRLRNGDLIVADASEDEAGIGKSVEVRNLGTTEAISGLHTILLRSRDQRVTNGYGGYLLETASVREQLRRLATGTKVFGISKRSIMDVRVMLPPPSQQRAIAETLLHMDGLLQGLEKLISKKLAIRHAVLRQLLTGATRLPGFDGKWKTSDFGTTCTFLPTTSNPRADLNDYGTVRYLHYGDVHAHTQPLLDCTRCDLPRIDKRGVGNAAPLQNGDLVMVDASEDLVGVGKSVEVQGVAEQYVVAGLHTILCRGNRNEWATGFKAYLQCIPAFKSALTRLAAGTSVYAISKKQLARVALCLPPRAEQEAIVSVLSDIDAEIAVLKQHRSKTGHIKRGMMQQLLTGRVRLVEPA